MNWRPFTLPATLPVTRIFSYDPTLTLPEVKKPYPSQPAHTHHQSVLVSFCICSSGNLTAKQWIRATYMHFVQYTCWCNSHCARWNWIHFFCCWKEPKQWVSQNNMWSFGECSVWSLQWKVSIKHAIFRIQNTFYTQMEHYLTFRIKSDHFGPSHFADNICCGSHILLFHVCLGIRI